MPKKAVFLKVSRTIYEPTDEQLVEELKTRAATQSATYQAGDIVKLRPHAYTYIQSSLAIVLYGPLPDGDYQCGFFREKYNSGELYYEAAELNPDYFTCKVTTIK